MNSWTDNLLILAIVIGLVSATLLPVVSVNVISSEALKLHEVRREAPLWLMLKDDAERRRVSARQEASVLRHGKSPMLKSAALDPTPAKVAPR